MAEKYTQEIIIEKLKIVHNNFYDYSLFNYNGVNNKVKIICPIHGEFEQKPSYHLKGSGCSICGEKRKRKKLTKNKEIFNKKACIIHNNFYDYSLSEYIGGKIKMKIICPIHGIFEQTPTDHLSGRGCPKCGNNIKSTFEEFIEKANIVHNNKYDYPSDDYINNKTKIKIICPTHGIFEQIPNSHLSGYGCLKCANKDVTTEEFNKKAGEVHNFIYDYSLSDYKKSNLKVKIICKKHGIFEQNPCDHLSGRGCPKCNLSKGEIEIKKILDNKNINYEIQKTFKGCEYLKPLKFDFYLPNINTCIEFDGEQHYNLIKYWGGEDTLNKIKERDKIKANFCKKNNIELLRIKYNENISEKLNEIK